MAKNKSDQQGFVYSTNPDFRFQPETDQQETLPPQQQRLRIQLETKHRGGKTASIVTGFTGDDEALQELAKKLKTFCGTGGSAKDGEIIIQGEHREKLLQWLHKNGYTQTKKSGG
ncbi:SUI1 family translation initiation factor [Niabella ginsenosidivorans]|uniref:SUI1 family translation initiation factor n=1 Tax=Niabella ginsenosidivorans TaxID=1176587 RepID=A0A1A9HWX7_9BACT|nr:translation initiation factor [Niabella ginsenosidivorans]ANH79887.1 SUI1 family translation initiation factor [Niabella ginsenosidivorans]